MTDANGKAGSPAKHTNKSSNLGTLILNMSKKAGTRSPSRKVARNSPKAVSGPSSNKVL